MQIYLPLHLLPYFKDIQGAEIINHEDHFELIIEASSSVLIDIFYRGAEYGADQYHRVAKENLQKSKILNKFGLN